MRIIETKVYTFDELSETVKQKAIENMYNVNLSCEWWEYTYKDARNFDILG